MQLNVKSTIRAESRKLTRVQKQQIPFATAGAINDTAFDVMRLERREVSNHIDRPTPFTKRGFRVDKATKRTLSGSVYIPPAQWKYMRFSVAGGTAAGVSNVPVNARRNAYGAMGRNYLSGLLRRKNTFSGTIKGVSGVWQRTAGGLKLIAAYHTGAHYRARFPFHQIGEREIRREFGRNFRRKLTRALRTAR